MTSQELRELVSTNYEQCSSLEALAIGAALYYPIYEPVLGKEPHLKKGEFLELQNDCFIVRIYGVGKFKDLANKFYTLNGNATPTSAPCMP